MAESEYSLGRGDAEADRGDIFYPGADQMGFAGFELPKLPSRFSPVATTLELPIQIESKRKLDTVTREVAIADINVLVQARDEYEGISVLAEAIDKAGVLLHTPFVAQFDEEGARRYLDFVYGIYGDKVPERKKFHDLTGSRNGRREDVFLIAVSGHRRLKALQHLGEERVVAKIAEDIDPLHALYLQAQENTPKLLKDYERAEQHGRLFAVANARNSDLTVDLFSKTVGQKADVVRRDLRYYLLPEGIKNYVVPRQRFVNDQGETVIPNQPLMSFNVACQLGRLVEAGIPEYDISALASTFFKDGVTSEKEASKRVTECLRDYKELGENPDMIDLFGYRAQRLKSLQRKKGVASRFEKPADDAISYFSRVVESRRMGLAGRDEDALSITGAASRLKNLAQVSMDLLPLLREVLEDEERERIAQIFEELKRESHMLEQVTGGESESPRPDHEGS